MCILLLSSRKEGSLLEFKGWDQTLVTDTQQPLTLPTQPAGTLEYCCVIRVDCVFQASLG